MTAPSATSGSGRRADPGSARGSRRSREKLTTLSIRPERVGLAPEARASTHNEFEARVEDLTFLGDHLRVVVSVLGTDDFIVKIPNVVGHGAVIPGDRVRIGWTPTDCRALDHEPESTEP